MRLEPRIVLDVYSGSVFQEVAEFAYDISVKLGKDVYFVFNGVELLVEFNQHRSSKDALEHVFDSYTTQLKKRI